MQTPKGNETGRGEERTCALSMLASAITYPLVEFDLVGESEYTNP